MLLRWTFLLLFAAACTPTIKESPPPTGVIPDVGEQTPPDRCLIPEAPDVSPMAAALAFPNLSFTQPIYATHAGDGSDRVFVVEKQGRILVFPNDRDTASATEFLNLTDRVFSKGGNDERGLLGLAFDPEYADNGYLYVNYTSREDGTPTVVSRFQVTDDANRADPDSELHLIGFEQPYSNHNGGAIDFGPDGMLYISAGDGGSGGDPRDHGQNLDTPLGSILRIDVRGAATPGGYQVPPDNPFLGNGMDEVWAYGLRNVWRFSFDRLTGKLWAADVGQRNIEEVDIIERGGNYGWRLMEGTRCFNPSQDCERDDLLPPVTEYDHSVGLSITGGYVYRGRRFPELVGTYIYGDFADGQIFALGSSDEPADPPAGHGVAEGYEVTELARTGLRISSFGEDEAGELFIVGYRTGRIYTLGRSEGATGDPDPFPLTLTATGCFSDVPNRTPDASLIPYDVNSPLYSDGTAKERFFVLPEGGKITYTPTGAWEFPERTTFIKHFFVDDDAGRRILETRFLVKDSDGWHGYAYAWNAEQTEAFLLRGAAERTVEVVRGGETSEFTWQFPSQAQCRACHTIASGSVLGASTGQLNREVQLDGGPVNQVDHFAALGLFDLAPPAAAGLPAYPAPDGAAPVRDRARSYLHANCAHCHLPDGVATSDIDLRYETTLADTLGCDTEPRQGDLGVLGLRVIDPGDPENSSVYLRMLRRDEEGMPSLASLLVDEPGAELVREWIAGLEGCQ